MVFLKNTVLMVFQKLTACFPAAVVSTPAK